MKHEGFDFTLNVWDEKNPKSDENDAWHGNIAVPHLIFDDREGYNKFLGNIIISYKNFFYYSFIFFNCSLLTIAPANDSGSNGSPGCIFLLIFATLLIKSFSISFWIIETKF